MQYEPADGSDPIGDHLLQARDARTGEIIDETRVHLGWRDRALLYAPDREGACRVLAEAVYGGSGGGSRTLLDPSAAAWVLPSPLQHVLEHPPESIYVHDRSTSETRWAVYVARCPKQGSPAED